MTCFLLHFLVALHFTLPVSVPPGSSLAPISARAGLPLSWPWTPVTVSTSTGWSTTPTASKIPGNYFYATPILLSCQNITIHFNATNLRNRSDDDYFRVFFANMPCSCQCVMFWLLRVIERKQSLLKSNITCQKGHFPLNQSHFWDSGAWKSRASSVVI